MWRLDPASAVTCFKRIRITQSSEVLRREQHGGGGLSLDTSAVISSTPAALASATNSVASADPIPSCKAMLSTRIELVHAV